MGTFVRVLTTLLVVAIVIGIGAAVYNAGVTAGLAEQLQQAAASGEAVVAPYPYGYAPGPYWHGPGFFGIIFWIFGIFLFIGLVRAAVGWGRWGGRGHGGAGGWGDRQSRMAEMHRELHRRETTDERPAGA